MTKEEFHEWYDFNGYLQLLKMSRGYGWIPRRYAEALSGFQPGKICGAI